MKFRLGLPPEDPTVSRETGWNLVNEPRPLNLQIAGLFVGLFIVICIGMVLLFSLGSEHVLGLSWPKVILFIILITPVHELVHAAGFKGGALSNRVVFGFYSKAWGFYAHYDGQISRKRYCIIAALPFLIITFIPLVIVAILHLDDIHLTEIIIANGLASSIDIITGIIILKETPRNSVLINSGMKTYWKTRANQRVDLTS